VALWSGASLGIWLLTLSSFSWGELIVGSACSLLVGLIAVAAQRVVGARWAPTAVSLRPLLVVPAAVASDAVQVFTASLWRRSMQGRFETLDIGATGPSPQAATRRAIATLATTLTPASIVVDVNDEGEMTIHALPTGGPHIEEGFTAQ
jgi:multisubunit Na+/H+ antiporter MnhE subunit